MSGPPTPRRRRQRFAAVRTDLHRRGGLEPLDVAPLRSALLIAMAISVTDYAEPSTIVSNGWQAML
jgi:hypothetical protein